MKLGTLNRRLSIEMGQVWVATILANALLYSFHLIVGRNLSPQDYGLFGALLGIVYIASALSNGVRISPARLVAHSKVGGDAANAGLLVTSALFQMSILAVGVLLAFSLASSLIGSYLHSTSLTPVITTGIVVFASLFMPVTQGALQGGQRFPLYSGALLLNASSRLLLGGAALGLKLGITGVLAAIGLASLLTTALGLAVIRPSGSVSLKVLPVGTFARVLIPT